MIPTSDYRPRQFRNWLIRDGILRLSHDRHYLFGASWEATQVYEPDCGCRFIVATLCPLPTITLTYEWYRDNPACPDVIANRAGRGEGT
jgi:hypothetical protein